MEAASAKAGGNAGASRGLLGAGDYRDPAAADVKHGRQAAAMDST